jgi:hypothetical protein
MMSTWVSPSIAAELWNISIEEVQAGIRSGKIVSKTEAEMLFVEMQVGPPATYSVISKEERAALELERSARASNRNDSEDEQSADIGDWREVRQLVSRSRRGPANRAA